METLKELELVLPWPPSANRIYRNVRGRTLLSRVGRTYRQKVIALLKGRDLPRFNEAIEVHAEFFPPDARRRDLDNYLKIMIDTLQHVGVFQDDSLIGHLDIFKKEPRRPDGRVVLRIRNVCTESG